MKNRVVDRLRDLFPDLRLLEKPHDLLDSIVLDCVEHRVELLLRHHQLRENAFVKSHVVYEAVEHCVQGGAQLDACRRLTQECAELCHRDGQIRRHRAFQRRYNRGRNFIDQWVPRSENGRDDVFEAGLERRKQLGPLELALKIARCEQSFADGAPKTLREARLVLRDRALESETLLLWIE